MIIMKGRVNKMRKTVVIGDTHGCYDEFEEMLEKTNLDLKNDRLVMLGDYIDRGSQSFEMLSRISALQNLYGKNHVVLLRGNHEQMLLDHLKEGGTGFLYNGGSNTLESFKRNGCLIESFIPFLESLPCYFEDDNFIYVHAGLKPGVSLEDQKEDDLLWIRGGFYRSDYNHKKPVIFGHTPTCSINGSSHPVVIGKNIALDTGCVYGGCLSSLEIQNGEIIGVNQVGRAEKLAS
jgi:serine/threonine protein phosphatase 1